MKFFMRSLFSKCEESAMLLWICSHTLKKFLMETFTLCNKSMVIFIKSCLVTLNKFFYFDFPWLRNTETTYMSFVNAIIEEEWQYH